MADQLADGTRFRALTIVDVFSREALAIEVGKRFGAEHVVASLNRLVVQRCAPRYLFVDNGSEFSGRLLDLWAYHHQVRIDFSRPGKPTDNSFVETFNGSLRDECLNVHWFETMEDAQRASRRGGATTTHIVVTADSAITRRSSLNADIINTTSRRGRLPTGSRGTCETGAVRACLWITGVTQAGNRPRNQGNSRTGHGGGVGRKVLLANGADVNAKESWRGQTALMWAAAEGNADAIRGSSCRRCRSEWPLNRWFHRIPVCRT